MATLTEVSTVARKIIKWGLIGMVVLTLTPGVIRIGKAIYQKFNPPPPPPPTVRYGKLPKLDLPYNSSEATPSYKLETIEGGLPKLASVGKVYVVGINKSRLLTLDRVKQKVVALGMTMDPIQIDDQTYRFIHPKLAADLLYNVVSGGFSYRYDWTHDPGIYLAHEIPIGNQAVSTAKNFLNNVGSLATDLVSGTSKFNYLVATGSAMLPTNSAYDANFVRVDLFRADKDNMKIVTVGGDTSPVNVIMSGIRDERSVVQANFEYSQILDTDVATYPLIKVDTAWQKIQAGQAFIAKRTIPEVTIRKVSLAYFESNSPQQFMQPVFMFEGDGGFMAYVPAIDPNYVEQ